MATSRTAAKRRRAQEIRHSRLTTAPSTGGVPPAVDDLEDDGGGGRRPTVRWPATVGLVLTLLGLADAAYLTVAHYSSTSVLACSTHGFVNCAKVTTSQYSHFLGMPVAVLGLAFFVAMVPLQLPWAWRSTHPYVRIGRLGACAVGVVMILWLVYAELFLIGSLCEYCTGVHILTLALFVSTALGTVATSPEPAY